MMYEVVSGPLTDKLEPVAHPMDANFASRA